LLADHNQQFHAILQTSNLPASRMGTSEAARIGQLKEWEVFGLLYTFSNFNAEMLRRAVGHDHALLISKNLLAESARLISDQIHPVMMVIGAVWLLGMGL